MNKLISFCFNFLALFISRYKIRNSVSLYSITKIMTRAAFQPREEPTPSHQPHPSLLQHRLTAQCGAGQGDKFNNYTTLI